MWPFRKKEESLERKCAREIAEHCKSNPQTAIMALVECSYSADRYEEMLKSDNWKIIDAPPEPPGQNHTVWTARCDTLYRLHAFFAIHKGVIYRINLGPENADKDL